MGEIRLYQKKSKLVLPEDVFYVDREDTSIPL
jgi:hypothetical protein